MIEHHIDLERGLAIVEIRGTLGDDEAFGWLQSFAAEVGSLRVLGGLIDTSGLREFDVSAPGLRRLTALAETLDPVFGGSRWAIVASLDVVFGMARMYEILRENAPIEIRVFRSLVEGGEWVGIPADQLGGLCASRS